MQHLFGNHNDIDISQADAVCKAELLAAGIPVFQGEPSPSRQHGYPPTSVIGAMQFASGQLAVFERAQSAWCLVLNTAMDEDDFDTMLKWSNGAIEDMGFDRKSIISVYTDDALVRLVHFLLALYGHPVDVDVSQLAPLIAYGGITHVYIPGLANLKQV